MSRLRSGLIALLTGALPLLVYYWRIWVARLSCARKHGRQSPPVRQAQPWYSRVYAKVRGTHAAKYECRFLAEVEMHQKYDSTFREPSTFGLELKTSDASNIQAVFSSHQWGIGPFRRRAMKPFCGDGLITNDGAIWEHSRSLLKPSFHRNNILDLISFERSVKSLIARIPGDGSTLDFQPLVELMVRETSN